MAGNQEGEDWRKQRDFQLPPNIHLNDLEITKIFVKTDPR